MLAHFDRMLPGFETHGAELAHIRLDDNIVFAGLGLARCPTHDVGFGQLIPGPGPPALGCDTLGSGNDFRGFH